MSGFTAQDVKELRERTGAGMMDCKKALTETDGDMETAIDWLRKKGLAAAAKKAGRTAAEGLIGIHVKGTTACIAEVNAETDFVARNDQFQAYVREVSLLGCAQGATLESVKAMPFPGTDRTVEGELTNMIAVIGENMTFRRMTVLSVSKGVVAHYLHTPMGTGLGRVGVLVALESDADADALNALGRQIAMHVAAAHPQSLNTDSLDQAVVEREKTVFREQALASGKPAEFVDKMVEGRLRKFYEEAVLLEQVFMIDDTKRKISQVVEDKAKELDTSIKLVNFIHYKLGDGIEKQETDFAAEVAQLSQ